jgi:xanthine/CO dehydrogenase XdhC/CoxF family maturation factor
LPTTKEKLKQFDLQVIQRRARGLRLGSKTPAEIAMAVMADILRVANGIQRSAL